MLGMIIDAEPHSLRDTLAAAHRHGWTLSFLDASPGLQLPVLTRPPPHRVPIGHLALYASAGIHGDEPAGPLAIHRLIADNALPAHAWLWVCPCLNPTGFQRNTREAASGQDLNRDYRQPHTPEVPGPTSPGSNNSPSSM
jgi:protein MpaA